MLISINFNHNFIIVCVQSSASVANALYFIVLVNDQL